MSLLLTKRVSALATKHACRLSILSLSPPLPLLHTPALRLSLCTPPPSSPHSLRYCATAPTNKATKLQKEKEKETSTTKATYTFHTGACSIPHPAKAKKGGEDAHYISSDNKVIAVADGVGGWSERGVDPANYSRGLMEGAKNFCEENIKKQKEVKHDAKAIMAAGYKHCSNIMGSSTCCVLDLPNRAANLGDSGFTIIREGKVFFSTEPQQHDFNFPFQLGSQSIDKPDISDIHEKSLKVGDVIVAATDGVFDNISPETIAGLVNHAASATQIADKIGKHARVCAEKTSGDTPFSIAARKVGYGHNGGKLDDITVVVAIVAE